MTEVFVDPDLVILFWFHPQVTNSSQFYLGGCRWTLAAFLLQQEGGGEDRGEEHGVEQREDREQRGTHAGWRITDTLIFQGSPCYHDRVGGATNLQGHLFCVPGSNCPNNWDEWQKNCLSRLGRVKYRPWWATASDEGMFEFLRPCE